MKEIPTWEEPGKKICKQCGIEKDITEFSKNQYGKNNRILRRPICRECYAKKVKPNPKSVRDFVLKYPMPKMGDPFCCPVCQRTFIKKFRTDIVLDHSHIDGNIRGYICNSCIRA